MRIQDIIRGFLNIIDQVEQPKMPAVAVITAEKPGEDSVFTHTGRDDDVRRFKQIVDLADSNPTEYANSPDEQYADVTAVTVDAGGGVNGPKHPADIKSNSISMYPNFLAKDDRHGC